MIFSSAKPGKILLVEDSSVDKNLLLLSLSKSSMHFSKIEHANCLGGALELLGKDYFDVVLLDLNLPDSKGIDTLLRMSEEHPEVAIVVITGESDEEFGLKAINSGAQEYLAKAKFDRQILTKSIYFAVERKNLERKLQLAEETYTIFENTAVAITMADLQGRLISWNKSAEILLGMEKEDLRSRPVESLYPGQEWEKMRNLNLRQKGMGHHFETRMIRKNGVVIDIDISLSFLKNSKAKTVGSVAVITDITERNRLYRILDRKQKNLEAIFDAAPVGMMLIDQSMIVRRVNNAISQMVHRKYSEIINRPVGDALGCINSTHDEKGCLFGSACATCPIRKTIETVSDSGQSVRGVGVHPTLMVDNERVAPWLCISAEPVIIDGHRRVVVAVEDVTQRKEAEEKLKETMELKSQFISTVSHELRTPLTCMKEAIAVVLDGAAGDINNKQEHFLNIAKRNIDRLAKLLNNVLDFQRLEAGRMKFNMRENDIVELIEHTYNTMCSVAEKKRLDFSVELEENLPKARFDSDKILQVLTNLISNAIKFTPEQGKVCVRVRCQSEELVIGVSDTGMGIPKEALPKIFDRFYRVPDPGKQIQGTGLGLAIVRQIVTMHGGRIEVESKVDQGTTFTVFLPLTPDAGPELSAARTDEILEDTIANN